MENLHILLCTLLTFCALFVIFAGGPIESMISLILMFCISGVILFLFNSEFLGVTFIIIYVGAIAVLFLFIIMMLNIKRTVSPFMDLVHFIVYQVKTFKLRKPTRQEVKNTIYTIFFAYIFFDPALQFYNKMILQKQMMDSKTVTQSLYQVHFESLENITVLGQSLFNYYSAAFLLAGLVLLVALIGAVVLTLNFNIQKKNQVTFRQLSRTDSFLSHFQKKDN